MNETVACRLLRENLDCPHLTYGGVCDNKVKYCTSQIQPFKELESLMIFPDDYLLQPRKTTLADFFDAHKGISPYTKHVCRIMHYRSKARKGSQ